MCPGKILVYLVLFVDDMLIMSKALPRVLAFKETTRARVLLFMILGKSRTSWDVRLFESREAEADVDE
jgi:hypothetical protein